MKKGTRVGCPQVQDRFSGFLRPRTPDLGLSRQQQGVSRKNYSFLSSVSKCPRNTLSHHSGAGSHKHFLLLRAQKRPPEWGWGIQVGLVLLTTISMTGCLPRNPCGHLPVTTSSDKKKGPAGPVERTVVSQQISADGSHSSCR